MDMNILIKELKGKMPGLSLAFDEPMSRHTSFRIGGPVAVMALPSSAGELRAVCEEARKSGIRPFIFGNGTNLLVQDAPLDILAVKTCGGLSRIELAQDGIYAESGALLSRIASFALQNGLSGFEFAHGIPGSLGGAVSMNAGAYGGEMKDVVAETEYLDGDLNLKKASGLEHGFSYRHSAFSDTDSVIIGSTIRLRPGEPSEIRARMDELALKRRTSQPLDMPSGGSTFKRPASGYAAALIDEAGLRGYAIGGAQVSEKHTGFIVNRGGATCDDVLRLIGHIQETVFNKTGIRLETEIKYIHE